MLDNTGMPHWIKTIECQVCIYIDKLRIVVVAFNFEILCKSPHHFLFSLHGFKKSIKVANI